MKKVDEEMPKRVLLVTAVFPPQLGGASEKMAKRTKYFSRYGWQTVVLAPAIPAGSSEDQALLNEAGEVEIHRTSYFFRSRWPSLRHDQERAIDTHRGKLNQVLDMAFVPKGYVRWLPHAVRSGRRLASSVDVILTMNNPITLHLVGMALHKATGKPWVAELRDPIAEYAYGRRGPETVNYWLERLVVRNCSAIIQREDFVPEPVVERYPNLPSSKFIQIPYTGFDPEDFAGQSASQPNIGDNPVPVIAYTGNFYGDTITPAPFLKGFKLFLERNPDTTLPFRVVFAGGWAEEYDRLVSNLGLESAVEYLGWLSRPECIELWQNSQILLLILSNEEDNRLRILSKFWDYLGAQRLMLALVATDGRLANLIRKERLGVVADPEDEEAIALALQELFNSHKQGDLGISPSSEFLAQANRADSERMVVEVMNRLTCSR